MAKKTQISLDERELAAVLCGLRCYQQIHENCGGDIPDDLDNVATNCGKFERLELEEVDELCERINFTEPHPAPAPRAPRPR